MTGPLAHEVSTSLDGLFAAAVAGGEIPGAALAIGRGDALLFRRCYGESATRAAPIRPVTAETRYDLASLTKVVATTTLALLLIERGRLHLDDPVVRYLPECRASGWERISLWHLLTHSSGLPATRPFWVGADRPLDLVQALSRTPPEFAPGERVQYSDLGFIALGEVCARVEGSPLDEVFLQTLARPLGLEATSYGPLDPSIGPIAATEVETGGTGLLGVVHDENARAAGGVSGHAGLFSTLSDLERFARFWVGRETGPPAWAWRERAVLPQVDGGEGRRGLGWACRGNVFDILGANWPPTAVSHTGFTGTSIALDLGSGAWVVLLTNAVHLSRDRRPLRQLRLAAHDLAGRLSSRHLPLDRLTGRSYPPFVASNSPRSPVRPAPPELLLVQIRALLPSLPPSEARVARATLEDPGGVAASTIGQLAARCQTSETTVVRFSRSLGLRGYPELRVALATAAGRNQQADRPGLNGDIGPADSLADVVAKVAFADAQAIEDTAAQLDLEVLSTVADRISAARRVDLYGVGASGFVALDLQQKLHRIGYAVFAWLDPNVSVTSASLLGPDDVAVGISHTGASLDTITALEEAQTAGATTVAITNFPHSPLARLADYVLTTAARETTFRSGAMASRVAQLSVVDCVFTAVAQRRYDATLLALERTHRAVAPRRAPDFRPDGDPSTPPVTHSAATARRRR